MNHIANQNFPVHMRVRSQLKPRDNLFGLMDDFFKEWGAIRLPDSPESFTPAIAVLETSNAYIVEAELPGVKRSDLSVDFQDGILTLKGEKKSFNEEMKDQYHRFERSHGSFVKRITIPKDADPEKISARMEDGVLRVEIARALKPEKEKRSIEIA